MLKKLQNYLSWAVFWACLFSTLLLLQSIFGNRSGFAENNVVYQTVGDWDKIMFREGETTDVVFQAPNNSYALMVAASVYSSNYIPIEYATLNGDPIECRRHFLSTETNEQGWSCWSYLNETTLGGSVDLNLYCSGNSRYCYFNYAYGGYNVIDLHPQDSLLLAQGAEYFSPEIPFQLRVASTPKGFTKLRFTLTFTENLDYDCPNLRLDASYGGQIISSNEANGTCTLVWETDQDLKGCIISASISNVVCDNHVQFESQTCQAILTYEYETTATSDELLTPAIVLSVLAGLVLIVSFYFFFPKPREELHPLFRQFMWKRFIYHAVVFSVFFLSAVWCICQDAKHIYRDVNIALCFVELSIYYFGAFSEESDWCIVPNVLFFLCRPALVYYMFGKSLDEDYDFIMKRMAISIVTAFLTPLFLLAVIFSDEVKGTSAGKVRSVVRCKYNLEADENKWVCVGRQSQSYYTATDGNLQTSRYRAFSWSGEEEVRVVITPVDFSTLALWAVAYLWWTIALTK